MSGRRTPSWGPEPKPWYKKIFSMESALYVAVAFMILCGLALFIGIIFSSTTNNNGNTDPRTGYVYVNEDLEKKCDGTTMIYHDTWHDTYDVSANSPECAQ